MSSFIHRHKKGLFATGTTIVVVVLVGLALMLYGNTFLSDSRSSEGVRAPGYGGAQPESYTQSPTSDAVSNTDEAVSERKVIRNGSLTMVVDEIDSSIDRITSLADSVGGFLEYTNVSYRGSDRVRGSVTIRVPENSFSDVFSQMKDMAIRVEHERINARDVTDQFVDLEARLRNAKHTEEQYLRILEQAEDVEDTLKVQQQLSRVRQEIERLEAQRTQLSRKIEMASIQASLISEGDVKILGVVWSPLNQIKQGFNNMVEGLVSFVNVLIDIIFALPVILLWIVLIGGILTLLFKGGKRFKHLLTRKTK